MGKFVHPFEQSCCEKDFAACNFFIAIFAAGYLAVKTPAGMLDNLPSKQLEGVTVLLRKDCSYKRFN